MSEKKCLVLINPCSGLRAGMKNLADILKIFSDGGYLPTVRITQRRDDAKEYSEAHAAEYDLVTCIGGDGTFNEVVAGVIASGSEKPIGYIPAGSTNDFARSLKLSTNILAAARDIVAPNRVLRNYDVGCFDGRIFTYVASFGAFTKASYATPQNVKNALGHLAYILEGIKDIPSIQSEHLTVTTDHETFEDDYIFGAVSNSTSLGGLLKLSPELVDMGDGLLELLLIKAPKNALDLVQILHCLNTQKYDGDWITFSSTTKLTVHTEKAMDWTLDGERQEGKNDLTVRNLHEAIRLIVPAQNATATVAELPEAQ